jgi:hypothetical protein
MLKALILVCSLATASNDCTRDNALDVVYFPATFDSPAGCMMRAQAYVANSSIGRDLPKTKLLRSSASAARSAEWTKPIASPGTGRPNPSAPLPLCYEWNCSAFNPRPKQ